MKFEPRPSNNDQEFILKAISQGIRVDYRTPDEMRTIKIALGPELGQSQVQLGKTRVACFVSCEIVRPSPSNLTEGTIQFNTEISTMSSPYFESRANNTDEIILSRMLEKALRKARAIDTEGLVIIAGQKVWAIRVDVRVLDNEGNLLDCAGIATIAALQHFRRPEVTVSGQQVIIHSEDEKIPIPLSIHHIPIFISFEFFDGWHVVDPLLCEELVGKGKLVLVMNIHREVCTMSKSGQAITNDKMFNCLNIAHVKVQEIHKILKEALKEDAEIRNKSK